MATSLVCSALTSRLLGTNKVSIFSFVLYRLPFLFSLRMSYKRTSPIPRSLWMIRNILRFYGKVLLALGTKQSWRAAPCRLSAAAYSLYSQLPYILEAVRPFATWGRAIPWWHGTTFHGILDYTIKLSI
jgi:hypothetical protein